MDFTVYVATASTSNPSMVKWVTHPSANRGPSCLLYTDACLAVKPVLPIWANQLTAGTDNPDDSRCGETGWQQVRRNRMTEGAEKPDDSRWGQTGWQQVRTNRMTAQVRTNRIAAGADNPDHSRCGQPGWQQVRRNRMTASAGKPDDSRCGQTGWQQVRPAPHSLHQDRMTESADYGAKSLSGHLVFC